MRIKHPFSGLSHAVGALLAVAGLVVLLALAGGEPWRTTAFAIYGATLILLYVASALYHSLHVSERAEKALYGLDRAGIYALIAGTYTPVCLLVLRGGWGWSLFGVIWGLAIAGIVTDAITKQRTPHWLQAALYLAMGWLFLVAIVPLVAALTTAQLVWLAAGVLIYTAGAAICVRHPRPHPGRLHFHDLWHTLVMAASACHYVLMLLLAR